MHDIIFIDFSFTTFVLHCEYNMNHPPTSYIFLLLRVIVIF